MNSLRKKDQNQKHIDIMEHVFGGGWSETAGQEVTKDHAIKLRDNILKKSKKAKDIEELVGLVCCKIQEQVIENNWLNTYSLSYSLSEEVRSKLRPRIVQNASKYYVCVGDFLSIIEMYSELSEEEKQALVYLSIILFDGVYHRSKVRALLRADNIQYTQLHGRRFVKLKHSNNAVSDLNSDGFYPGPITNHLIDNANSGASINENWLSKTTAHMFHTRLGKEYTLAKIISYSAAHNIVVLPIHIESYSSSQSSPSIVLDLQEADADKVVSRNYDQYGRLLPDYVNLKLLEYKRLLEKNDAKQFHSQLQSEQDILPSAIKHCLWMIYGEFVNNKDGRSQSNGKSLYKRYIKFIKKAAYYSMGDNLETYSEQQWIELFYFVVKGEGKLNTLKSLKKAARRFALYLDERGFIQKSALQEYCKPLYTKDRVKAYYITSEQFDALIDYISENYPSDSQKLKILVYLAYFCGLRKEEALAVRRCDIIGNSLLLYIIPTKYNDWLKSAFSNRGIPVSELMQNTNFEQDIKVYLDEVRKTSQHYDDLLFPRVNTEGEIGIDKALIDKINYALKVVTGIKDISYHSLRHTFCNRLVLSYEYDRLADQFSHELLDKVLGKYRIDTTQFHTLVTGGQNTRKYMYQVSAVMGHLGVMTTIESYCHFFPLLLHIYKMHDLPKLTMKQLSALTGMSKSKLYALYSSTEQKGEYSLQDLPSLLEKSKLQRLAG